MALRPGIRSTGGAGARPDPDVPNAPAGRPEPSPLPGGSSIPVRRSGSSGRDRGAAGRPASPRTRRGRARARRRAEREVPAGWRPRPIATDPARPPGPAVSRPAGRSRPSPMRARGGEGRRAGGGRDRPARTSALFHRPGEYPGKGRRAANPCCEPLPALFHLSFTFPCQPATRGIPPPSWPPHQLPHPPGDYPGKGRRTVKPGRGAAPRGRRRGLVPAEKEDELRNGAAGGCGSEGGAAGETGGDEICADHLPNRHRSPARRSHRGPLLVLRSPG